MSFFSDFLLKQSYKSVYGNKAIIKIGDDNIEVLSGNRKIIHNKDTSTKLCETFYDDNKVRIVKYDAEGNAEVEETYIDGEKQSEKALGNGKITNVEVNDSGLETSISTFFKENIEYKETTYKYKNETLNTEYTVILLESEKEILKNIVKKQGEEVVVDVQKRMLPDGRISFYKLKDLEIEIDYYDDGKNVKKFSKHWEEPIYETPIQSKGKKNQSKEENKKVVGTKIKREIVEYNKKGNIVYLETDEECINKEYDAEGNLKRQYCITQGEHGKEIVGKLITDDKDIKIINNSTFPNDRIVKMNEDMDVLEFRYEDNLVVMYDFMFWNGEIDITEEYFRINNKFSLKKRIYDKIENGVDYNVEETYKGGKVHAVRTINKLSKTELYSEGNRRFIKGFNGIEKEITEEEFEVYKMADALNKI